VEQSPRRVNSGLAGNFPGALVPPSARLFVGGMLACACLSAALAGLVPLQISIISVFLFAGPHNWFEARYFLQRLPLRFGKSRNYFIMALGGVGLLAASYSALPLLYYTGWWSGENWLNALAIWNTTLLLWLACLVWMRGRQRGHGRDWSWAWPVAFLLCALNWQAPQVVSVALVYLHPLVALWFLDRHLRRTRPEWLPAYHRCLWLVPVLGGAICWQLASRPSLPDDNGLAWRIAQNAGTDLFPHLSSHMLVAVHVFLEMLHYGVWLIALPLIGARGPVWDLKSIPLVKHPHGYPRLIGAALCIGLLLVFALWLGFSVNYVVTRDIYFAVAVAHVLAEAPFLLRML